MAARKRLRDKLKNGSITAIELRTLFRQEGWSLNRTKGSHQIWIKGEKTFVLAVHSKELKLYQKKQAQQLLLKGDK